MFVKHITESDLVNEGFQLNTLFRSSFWRQTVDSRIISTHMQVWVDVTTFKYKIVTNREGCVQRGTVQSKKMLRDLVEKFFENEQQSFLIRQIQNKQKRSNEEATLTLLNKIPYMGDAELEGIVVNTYGECYA